MKERMLKPPPPYGWKVWPVENLWWRHWRWEAFHGDTGYEYGLAATEQSARRKAKAALSRLAA